MVRSSRSQPGDAYVIEPGHDGWVVGDEDYVAVDFSEQMAEFAKRHSAAVAGALLCAPC